LFFLLSMKVNRFASRFRRWTLDPWEFDDVLQEAYLAFDDLLRTWQPLEGNGGPAGFGFYFLRVFPLRLHDRVLAMTRTRSDQPLVLPWQEAIDLRPDPVDRQSDAETALILAEICGHLNAVDEAILRCRVADTSDVSTIAMRVGVSRRTLYRRWGRIIAIARNEWGNREAG
jgi:RNA polymerase sigma factor (sigma-70 family)